jgi:hypothetical protein
MPIQTVLRTEASEVERRLRPYGLSHGAMEHLAIVWGTEMRSGNKHLPRVAPAFNAWARGTETLRNHAADAGFVADYAGGVELCVNKAAGLALVLCAGSAGTGDPLSRHPHTKHPRGARSREVLLAQTAFPYLPDARPDDGLRYETWIALLALRGGVVYAELSLPATVSERGHVGTWRERNFLPPVDLNAPMFRREQRSADPSSEASDEIDVPVKPRI